MQDSTICAISTGLTSSGIGIVRISGHKAFSIIKKIFKTKKDIDITEGESHKAYYGHIISGREVIDEVIVLIMKGPHTYTTEDTVEINCHGGVAVMKKVLDLVVRSGARIAEPGEFTKRAYLNGRIDLSRAEAVMDLISSKNEMALKNSVKLLDGGLYEKIRDMRDMILEHTAYIEAALDDPEHYSLDSYGDKILPDVDKIISDVDNLLKTFDNGRIITEGIRTVIVGKPNVGKSTLLNILSGSEKAIVTDIPGTTRDYLEEEINLDGITLNLVDTAGIRQANDEVERIGVERSFENMESADLVIYVVDLSVPLDDNDEKIMSSISGRKSIVLLNKSDLETRINIEYIKARFDNILIISAKEHKGTDELKKMIRDMFFNGELSFNDEICITNLRQKNLLSDALESLHLVRQSVHDGMPEDFFSIDLLNAYNSLGFIIGESVESDLIDEIFEKFCMGK
ncbi:MAG: tRNA uridine-5-carboxymethylaminomethyl(34) synthesis GTPase MnmE [Lachnospiraceae bacterium]|nr:tRNA uridine-5-carboxymethylaminomethyl(34) synthesis GTPase MnmE [Lachnospiraceae bacterium]